MEKDKQNNTNSINTNTHEAVLFVPDSVLYFIFKKTEKIAAGLYVVTNLLSDNEPLKWRIREKGTELVSSGALIGNVNASFFPQHLQNALLVGNTIISFLHIAFYAGLISEMNCLVLKKEMEMLIEKINEKKKPLVSSTTPFLARDFFDVKDTISFTHENSKENSRVVHKVSGSQSIKDNTNKALENKDISKDKRQDTIVSLLKKDSMLSVKDFTKVITDCSEKTIQRELLLLVKKGVLRKEGERRWSRYSLS
jgi:hypothetical protein